MLPLALAAAIVAAGLAWIYHTRAKPAVKPRTADVAKRERFKSAAQDTDLRALRANKGSRIEFGQR